MNKHYAAIRELYGDKRAVRSGVPLIHHFNEGLHLLNILGASRRAKEAFCIHPLLQDEKALQESLRQESVFQRYSLDPAVVVLAMEYRHVANNYLSQHCKDESDVIELSCLPEANLMLMADKVQNRKDFERYHFGSHPHSTTLALYFRNWLRRLNISETRYQELVSNLEVTPTEYSALFEGAAGQAA